MKTILPLAGQGARKAEIGARAPSARKTKRLRRSIMLLVTEFLSALLIMDAKRQKEKVTGFDVVKMNTSEKTKRKDCGASQMLTLICRS